MTIGRNQAPDRTTPSSTYGGDGSCYCWATTIYTRSSLLLKWYRHFLYNNGAFRNFDGAFCDTRRNVGFGVGVRDWTSSFLATVACSWSSGSAVHMEALAGCSMLLSVCSVFGLHTGSVPRGFAVCCGCHSEDPHNSSV